MKNTLTTIASALKYKRLNQNLDQTTVANEIGVSLRTIQNIEAGKSANSSSLCAYLDFLGLLENMLATLPDPNQLTPMEILKATPKRRKRARRSKNNSIKESKINFTWADES